MTPAARLTAARAGRAAAVAVAGLLLAAGCSSAPPPPGQQAAQDTRVATAREYWRMLAVIVPELFPGYGGTGQFTDCPPTGGGTPAQVAYAITNRLLDHDGRLAPGPFTSQLERLLHAHGWSAFTSRDGKSTGTSGGYRLQLQPVTGDVSLSAILTLSGPCVTVGAAFAKAAPGLQLNDGYPNGDVTASPTPTGPLPAP
jgi:hypothetical protein